jgi:P4 family phage/plasmid primase-like protien
MVGSDTLRRMQAWLEENRDRVGASMLMPVKKNTKAPCFPHASAPWDERMCAAFATEHPEHKHWGLLLDKLCTVDADDAETVAWIESHEDPAMQDALQKCAIQRTRKGRHYIFYRPAWADAEGFWDGARQAAAGGRCVDLKTRCGTGTRGLLSIAPTPGKSWERAPWDAPDMPDIPRALLELVATPKGPKKTSAKPTARASNASGGVLACTSSVLPPLASFVAASPMYKLLSLLGKHRWDDRNSWRDIATALKNADGGGDTHLEVWLHMSRISPKFDPVEAAKCWATVARPDYEGPKLGAGSLERWACLDDPHGYAVYRAHTVPAVAWDHWERGEVGLARIAYELLSACVKRVARNEYFLFDEDECRWMQVDEGRVKSVVSDCLERVLRDIEVALAVRISAAGAGDNSTGMQVELQQKKKAASKCVALVQSMRGATNVLGFAGALLHDPTFQARLDSHPHLLGVKGGVVDLRTGVRRARCPDDMVYAECEAHAEEGVDAAWVHRTVIDMMGGDVDMARFLQLVLGYAVTGDVSEEIFVILTGQGRNGKGVLMRSLCVLLGSLYQEMNCAVITDKRACCNIDAERAKLLDARLAVFNELEQGERLKTSEMQLLSGGDGIPAKALYHDPITITPRHLCILTTNHMPGISEVIPAVVERVLVVPFTVTFRDLLPGEAASDTVKQCDKGLKARFASPAGREALLRWLIDGAVAWYASNESLRRCAPPKVHAFTKLYLDEQDSVQGFLVESCVTGPNLKVSSDEVLLAFNDMRIQSGLEPVNSKWLVQRLKAKGFDKKQIRINGRGGLQGYVGFQLKEERHDEEDPLDALG